MKLCRRLPANALSGGIRKWARSEVKSALGHVGATGLHRRTGSEERLFRRLEQRRGAGTELLEQRRLVGLGSLEVAQLDVAEAADLLRDGGKPDRDVVVAGIELRQHLLEERLVVAH